MIRAVAIVAAVVGLIAISGGDEEPAEPLSTRVPAPVFEARGGELYLMQGARGARPLGENAPDWAEQLHYDSAKVLLALSDPDSGALIAGDRERWDYVWPRDAAVGAIAFVEAAMLGQGETTVEFLEGLDLEAAARFTPDGEPVPGRPVAGDAAGWVTVARSFAERSVTGSEAEAPVPTPRPDWRDRQDYGENETGDMLGNAIVSGESPATILDEFLGPNGLVREEGSDRLDSAAAWAVFPFRRRALYGPARQTLLALADEAGPFGIEPMEDWSPDEAWTAPTAWTALALIELGELEAGDRMLAALRRSVTSDGTLPERVDAETGEPTSTTPLAWSHAWAMLALQSRWPYVPS